MRIAGYEFEHVCYMEAVRDPDGSVLRADTPMREVCLLTDTAPDHFVNSKSPTGFAPAESMCSRLARKCDTLESVPISLPGLVWVTEASLRKIASRAARRQTAV